MPKCISPFIPLDKADSVWYNMDIKKKEGDAMLHTTEKEYRTKGGIAVYLLPSMHLHSFSLSLYIRGGAMFEADARAGISHFIEHLVFRSINRYMGGTLYETLDRMGLAIEGVTYREFLQFSITGAPLHFETAARILALALRPLNLSAEDIRTERERVKAEIREEGERSSLDFFTDRLLFGEDHPLSRPITGTATTLRKMTLPVLQEEKACLFSGENLFFYLSGRLPENAVTVLSALCADHTPCSAPRRLIAPRLPDGYFHRDARVAVKGGSKTVVRLSFDIDTTRYTDAALTLLYDILFGEGEACFFHQALSEKTGMIYSFRGYMELYRNIGSVGVCYEIPPSGLLPSLRLAIHAINRTKSECPQALPFVRAPYIDNAAFLFDDAAALSFNRAYERYILELPYPTVSDRRDAYARVTGEELSHIAREIFRPENVTLTLTGRKQDTAALREILLEL